MKSSLKINSTQMNGIDSNRLSNGIRQYMDGENYSYKQATTTVLQNEGWELRNVAGLERYKEFYNTESGETANAVWYNTTMVPATDNPFVTNALRV